MATLKSVSPRTRNNWLIDFGLFFSGLISFISGIYFLFLPIGGYQGGRNAKYGIIILFERHTWESWHSWVGLAMIAIAAIHIPLHWAWIVNMTRRVVNKALGRAQSLSSGSKFNLLINSTIGLSFLFTALSGLYFFFFSVEGGTTGVTLLFSPAVWDLIHTWAGTAMIAAAVLHFAIHWKWVTKVTTKLFKTRSRLAQIPVRS
ncbi:MAG: DUF4405 domain-containing protein [Chloroflexi bacterium]|jgi:hypothetical protein|nr:DUF4405 domain-containing protein [Chloroflexota bacterium]